MKMDTRKPNDRKARIVGIPLLSFAIAAIVHSDEVLHWGEGFRNGWVISFLTTLSLWESNRQYFLYFRHKFPFYQQTHKRLAWQTITIIASNFLISLLLQQLCYFLGNDDRGIPFFTFVIALIPTVILILVYESAYFFGQWEENVRKTEQLARENIESQLEALKNQLDPHFLFNSLNTLASLIDEENTPAQDYLLKLSDVYRYVLVNRQKNTVTLEEEMAFVDAYIYLNKTRFREHLQVENRISEAWRQKHIAPLSLQIAIENALKHNVISKEKPLTIQLMQDEDEGYLVIRNNLQEKRLPEKSTKIGLQNIINRYGLLSDKPVLIRKSPTHFSVSVPVL
jgi:hypothetical protein